ncbi:hypothetical protein GQ53DRAFT_356217 [Thozetella sp. PMI_491]|nr:hypothetical protein GQ53DRAFT_356217 [Thozetella sp. PMI_491]
MEGSNRTCRTTATSQPVRASGRRDPGHQGGASSPRPEAPRRIMHRWLVGRAVVRGARSSAWLEQCFRDAFVSFAWALGCAQPCLGAVLYLTRETTRAEAPAALSWKPSV